MDIEEFIRETLKSIANGIYHANRDICEARETDPVRLFQLTSAGSSQPSRVAFDLAVTSRSSKEGAAGAKATIMVVELAAGGKADTLREEVSRISFEVSTLRDLG